MNRPSAIALVVALALSAAANSARAGSYDVVTCGDTTNTANNSWIASNSAPTELETGNGCGGAGSYGGLYARDALAVPNAAAGDSAQWIFTAPPGTSITGVSYSRWFYKEDDDDWQPGLFVDGSTLETCAIVYPAVRCNAGVLGGQRSTKAINGAKSISIGTRCSAPSPVTCGNGGTMHAAIAVLYGATVTLSDASAPSLSNVAGSLFEGGYQTGLRTAVMGASDNAGVRSGRVYVDGSVASTTAFGCDFTYAVPCSDKVGAEVPLDTRSLPDGSHDVQVAAVDPAGNESRSSVRTVSVDNSAPSAPSGLVVAGGSDWRSENAFSVAWTNPSGQVAPVVAGDYQLCDHIGNCLPAQRVTRPAISSLDAISVPSTGEWTLHVWLEDAAGNADPASTATAVLRYGSAPRTTSAPEPGLSESLPSALPSAGSTTTETQTSSAAGASSTTQSTANSSPLSVSSPLASPGLRLTSARYLHGHLVLRGRAGAAGRVLVRFRFGHRGVAALRRVRGGAFRISVRTRRPSRVAVEFGATALFHAQRVVARVR